MHLLSLDGKVAVVTGGARGIGAATARVLEDAGARVTVFDLTSDDDLAFGSAAVDVTDDGAVKAAFARVVEQHGRLDILVNNAGRVARKPAVELDVAEWQAVIDVNLTATFLCSRLAHDASISSGSMCQSSMNASAASMTGMCSSSTSTSRPCSSASA